MTTSKKSSKMNPIISPHLGTNGAEWHLIDAKNQVLGRMASDITRLLLGKHRVDSQKHTVAPVYVVVTNTDHVVLTGTKEISKRYTRVSGYPGGVRHRTVAEQRARDSRFLVHSAVTGMLPKNNLRAERLRHLKLYPSDEHPHKAQLTTAENKNGA